MKLPPQAAAEKETREKREFVDHSDRCERFGFDDHNPCPLAMIRPFCESLQAWLSQREFAFSAMQCGQWKLCPVSPFARSHRRRGQRRQRAL